MHHAALKHVHGALRPSRFSGSERHMLVAAGLHFGLNITRQMFSIMAISHDQPERLRGDIGHQPASRRGTRFLRF